MKSTAPGARTCILVLGMHRSGTSALTRLLNFGGAALPQRLLGAGDGNETGHWEPQALVDFHDRLLQEVGATWHDWGSLDFSRLSQERVGQLRGELLSIIKQDFGEAPLFVVKDPRICRFVPFFTSTLAEAGIRVAPILILRNPLDVVRSLEARKEVWPPEFGTADGALLWLRHVLDADETTRKTPRAVITYDDVLQDWRGTFAKIARDAKIAFPNAADDFASDAEGFLSQGQRHQRHSDAELLLDPIMRGWVNETYSAGEELARKSGSPAALARLDAVRTAFYEALPLLAQISSIRQGALGLLIERNRQLEEAQSRLDTLAEELIETPEIEELELGDDDSALPEVQQIRAGISAFKALAVGQKEKIRELNRLLTEHQRDLQDARNKLSAMRRNAAQFDSQLATANAEIAAMKNSASFRITAPLRKAKTAVKTMAVSSAAIRTGIKRRGGLIPTAKKTVHVLRHHGISGMRLRLRALTDAQKQRTSIRRTLNSYPLVSIIVPNYNHAAFLEQRLKTIFAQAYQNFELIMLDDCSTDGSMAIMRRFEEQYPGRARIVANIENSGSGYRQWAKGIAMARGDLIWIAESDDWSDPRFLQALVPCFEDESVMLAYCNSAFMDAEGENVIWSTPEYLSDLDKTLWTRPFSMTAPQLVRKGWALKNIVPNVSGAVFRNPRLDTELSAMPWTEMKICGDWLFYLGLVRGGSVAYLPDTLNYYRIHEASTAKGTFRKDVYYREHEMIAKYALEHFDVPDDFIEKQQENLQRHWKSYRDDYSDDLFVACYEPERLRAAIGQRKPSIMMAGFAFCAGGGETFPIFLANLLKERGYPVTFLSCEMEDREEGIRSLLRADIPIVTDLENIAEVVEDYGIDIIHSHHASVDHSIATQLPKSCSAKTVVSMHGMYEMMEPIDRDAVLPRVMERAAALVFTSQKNLEPFENLGVLDHPKLVGIPNALPEVALAPVKRASLGISEEAFVVCVVTRAIPEKGWAEAIEAVSLAREKSGRDIQLLMIGEGPEYDRLSKPGAAGDFVKFLGFKQNLRDYFAAADIGLLPSRFRGESFPLALIDCLAAGRPMIASDVGEIREMLDADGELAGAVYKLNNWQLPIEDMADLIAEAAMRGDTYDQMVEAAPEAYRKFDPDLMVDRYISVYMTILRGEAPLAAAGHSSAVPPPEETGAGLSR
ncbi:glycosyltransferase [Methyloligella sp. 2.7D]|uniref:glycosyltransferase n=1 Tax=unclassified Methyloligella TaxID=2625955 RepID=UPI00157C8F31|nr:glycosyltransferase [Methyloligella sp. GL2]QKP77686.1 glycosyltransferase [Methyloligella sp. GL2]